MAIQGSIAGLKSTRNFDWHDVTNRENVIYRIAQMKNIISKDHHDAYTIYI